MAEEDKTQLFGSDEGLSTLKPPYLVIVDGPHKGARFPLAEGQNVIGRLEECHVILDDQSVSRKHAQLNFSAQGWSVEDLGSKNATFVNGAPIEESVVIGHKDLIRTGIYTLRLITEELPQEEELDIPPQAMEEWGTAMVDEGEEKRGEKEGELPVPGREITAPHSPLEEHGAGIPKKSKWLPKARIWVLAGAFFLVVLAAGLYLYWQLVLTPPGKMPPKAPPIAAQPSEPQTIPLGPPEPVKPKTIPIFLDCIANPFPALVRFEDKELGRTPLKVNVELEPEKEYEIEAVFDMPEIQEKYTDRLRFSVTPEQSLATLLFRAPIGTIKVTSLPRDVSFYLEGFFEYNKFVGKPVKVQNLVLNKPIYVPYGRYVLELRAPMPVGETGQFAENIIYRREFVLEEDNPAYLLEVNEASLKEFPAEIRSVPLGADVFIDQIKVGQTPYIGNLPVGKHRLTLHKEGYFEISQEIATDINSPFKTEITLKTSPAGEKINAAKGFINQGLYEQALQSLAEGLSLNPTPGETAETQYLLGTVYLRLKDYSKAQGYFEQAQSNENFKYWAKLGLANTLAEQQQMRQALIPLVEVLLNAKDETVLQEAHNTLRKVSPLRSVVYIQSEPAGARVSLNDKKLAQRTPILLHDVGLGTYRIRLEKPGYQPLDLSVNLTINQFNPVLAKLKPVPQ
ncbi:MAG: PEGA domain-containing protein [Deltaproteobacteria bacterium]|nr:PEGA domain-containing protein [Deltaproteobacteria bacterium]